MTILQKNGNILARYDSNTENLIRQYNKIGSNKSLEEYVGKLKENITTQYVTPSFSHYDLIKLYRIHVEGNSSIQYGAPWYGNEAEIQKRIIADITGGIYTDITGKITYNKEEKRKKKIIRTIKE